VRRRQPNLGPKRGTRHNRPLVTRPHDNSALVPAARPPSPGRPTALLALGRWFRRDCGGAGRRHPGLRSWLIAGIVALVAVILLTGCCFYWRGAAAEKGEALLGSAQ
jgi:hypothetical protein